MTSDSSTGAVPSAADATDASADRDSAVSTPRGESADERDTAHGRDTAWLDREAYPFDSHCVGLSAGAVHYVDEGPEDGGRGTLLMLHGNPTWSFLYRHLVRGLGDEYRCIALDYLGFGLSERPPGFSYRPEDHAAVVAEFVAELGLTDLTLVVQDWGGPIGLSYALDHPENVRALVVMNTWVWPIDDDRVTRAFSRLLGGPLGRGLSKRYNVFARYVMPRLYADPSRLTPEIHRHYLEPLSRPEDRRGSWVFPREILGETEWLASLWDRRGALADYPALLVWGMEDPGFDAGMLRVWQALFPDATVHELDGVGHYVQEEMGPDLAPLVRAFLDGLPGDEDDVDVAD
ncbi:alpha/beta fold hydrolase [Halobium salinum]|uniref:Alpha/beta fold hydrolase n=1 Tax=Halobium salinum TaxID=1364940 RepID=A0ABD5PA35_9EURY|nr:alpha/beta fold hydrolase [Halobium salinum]